jgi:hypothetical protein
MLTCISITCYCVRNTNQARPGHMCNMCRGIGPPKNKGLDFILYSSNISKLRDVKFNIFHKTANVQLLNP